MSHACFFVCLLICLFLRDSALETLTALADLRSLHLGPDISTQTLSSIALHLTKLTSLSIARCTHLSGVSVFGAIRTLTRLRDFAYPNRWTNEPEAYQLLTTHFTSIMSLHLSYSMISPRQLWCLSRLRTLERLFISKYAPRPSLGEISTGLAFLSTLSNLRSLELRFIPFEFSGVHCSALTHLTDLRVERCAKISSLQFLPRSIRTLNLSASNVPDLEVICLASRLSYLTDLNLSQNDSISAEILTHIEKLTALRRLNVASTLITPEILATFSFPGNVITGEYDIFSD